MNDSVHLRLLSALWIVLVLSLATATAGVVGLSHWMAGDHAASPADSPAEAAVLFAAAGDGAFDHSVVMPLEAQPADELPSLTVAAYER